MLVADTQMLKDIMVKHFDCFQNRKVSFLFWPKDLNLAPFKFRLETRLNEWNCFQLLTFGEYPLNLMLNILRDDHWKHVRTLVSPTFSAVKLKKVSVVIVPQTKAFVVL